MTSITRLGLENLARQACPVTIPGVSWHEYSFPLEGEGDARAEADALFQRIRKAEWLVIMDSAGRSWVYRRGETVPVVTPEIMGRRQLETQPRLALPPPALVDVVDYPVSDGTYADLSQDYPEVETTRRTCGIRTGPNWSPIPPLMRMASGTGAHRELKVISSAQGKFARLSEEERQAVREAAMRTEPRLTWVAVPKKVDS